MSARRPTVRALCVMGVMGVTAACGTTIAQPQDVRGLRVLAMLSDPAEARPGDTVRLRVVVGGAAGPVRARWSVCARVEEASTSLPISSFGQLAPDEGCDGANAADVRALEAVGAEGVESSLRVPTDALENDAWLAAAFAGPISRERRRELARVAGLPLVVTVTVTAGGASLRAFERVVVFPRGRAAASNSNPPRPSLAFGDARVVASRAGALEEECQGASELAVAPGTTVTVRPDETDSSWLETYSVLDATGRAIEVREQAFFNFFSTAGVWDLGRARQPDRAPTWTAPMVPGEVTHWVTLRDGRGGTSVCRYAVRVR